MWSAASLLVEPYVNKAEARIYGSSFAFLNRVEG
jgi:hypothetical protein